MANVLYDPGRESYLTGGLNWASDTVKVCLVKSTYTFSAAHQFMSSVTAADNGRSAALASKTTTSGVADAADTSLVATTAAACNALVIFKDTGSDATSNLICYIDTPASGLPFTPAAGQTLTITFDNGTNRIFKL